MIATAPMSSTIATVTRNSLSVVGARVPDAQYAFRLRLGPMPLAAYQRLLPGGEDFQATVDWVRNYVGLEYAWDLQLVLRQPEVPGTALGGPA